MIEVPCVRFCLGQRESVQMNNNQTGNGVNTEEPEGTVNEWNERSRIDGDFYDKLTEKRVSEGIQPQKIAPSEIEKYRLTKCAKWMAYEKMFSLVNQHVGMKVLVVGCGTGGNCVLLASLGKEVTAIDISATSVEFGELVAKVNNVKVNFQIGDITQTGILGKEEFDIVWCEAVLHHVVPDLDVVISNIADALKPGGLFVSAEPVAYARWLRIFAKYRPGGIPDGWSPNECPLRTSEFEIIRRFFPNLYVRHHNLLRPHLFFRNPSIRKILWWIEPYLLMIPGMKRLAGHVLMWAYK